MTTPSTFCFHQERFGPAMKLRYPYEEERYRNLLDIDAAEEAAAEFADSLLSSDGRFSYWIDRRDQFFKNTTFTLSDKVRKLIGSPYGAPSKSYHLPFWFDYEVFKRMVSRINETPQEELKSHHKYIDSCLEIWNDTASERLGQLDYEAGGITSHVDIVSAFCSYVSYTKIFKTYLINLSNSTQLVCSPQELVYITAIHLITT